MSNTQEKKDKNVFYEYDNEFFTLNKLFKKQSVFPENYDKISYRQFPYAVIYDYSMNPNQIPLIHFNKTNQKFYQELTGFDICFDSVYNIKVFCQKVINSKALKRANYYELSYSFIILYDLAVSTLFFIENIMPDYDSYLKSIQPPKKKKRARRKK